MDRSAEMDKISKQIALESAEAEAWGTKEGYSLSGLKIAEYLSEETTAFAAKITKNGKVVGYAKNDGHGGSTLVEATGLDNKDYGKLETWVDTLVERHGEQKWIDRNVKSMTKTGVDFILLYRQGSQTQIIGDYGKKAEVIANSNKKFGCEPYKVYDLTATSGKARADAADLKTAKWKAKIKADMKSRGLDAVVFYVNEKGGTSAKPFKIVADADKFSKTVKGAELVVLL